jgi:hypothetical protein
MRLVGSIVVVVNTKSIKVSTAVTESTQPIIGAFVDNIGPIGVPVEFANCIVM